MGEVQVQLQELKARLDEEAEERFSEDEEILVNRVEELREEFRELLIEMRRKRSVAGSGLLSDDVSIKVRFCLYYFSMPCLFKAMPHGSDF